MKNKRASGYADLLHDPYCGPKGGKKNKPQRDGGWALMNRFIKTLKAQNLQYRVDEYPQFIRIQWQEKQ